jgi:hypothetical protein
MYFRAKLKKLLKSPKKFFADSILNTAYKNKFYADSDAYNIDSVFAKNISSIAKKFGTHFNNAEIYFLQTESQKKDFTTKTKSIYENNNACVGGG